LPKIEFAPKLDPAVQNREQAVFFADVAHLRSSLESLDGQIAVSIANKTAAGLVIVQQELLIAALRESLGMQQAIAEKGLGSRASVLNSEATLASQLTSLANLKGQVLRADSSAKAVEKQKGETLAKFQDDQSQALSTALEKRDELAQSLVKASAKLGYTRLFAPITGVVQDVAITTVGQVVRPGQELMIVVPENARLEAEALVINKDIGFVAQGQSAVLKIDSFPFTRYGTIPGKVIRVSHDSVSGSGASVNGSDTSLVSQTTTPSDVTVPTPQVQDLVYPVTIALEKTTIMADGKAVPLLAGMNATVEIRTGDRRVIDFLLAPIREVASEAAHER
jgi:hemolysin D